MNTKLSLIAVNISKFYEAINFRRIYFASFIIVTAQSLFSKRCLITNVFLPLLQQYCHYSITLIFGN